jgi:hypothetical protein
VDAGSVMRRRAFASFRLALAAVCLVTIGVAGVSLAACSKDDSTGTTAPDASTTTVDTLDPSAQATTTSLPLVGDPINRFTLQLGDCFNRYESLDITTRVPCEVPHDREVFHTESYPAPFGEPFPGERKMQSYALQVCYAHFQEFVGVLYEVSRLAIGAITPTQQNFEDAKARYRAITCFLDDNHGQQLTGSMRGSGN